MLRADLHLDKVLRRPEQDGAARTSRERINCRLENRFDGHSVGGRVSEPIRAMCHLMLGIEALMLDQLDRSVT